MSENSWNATLYYEVPRFGARLSVNNRDDYITENNGANGNVAEGTTGPVRYDMSAFYNFTESFSLTLEGINLSDEPERLYTTGRTMNLVREYNYSGRQDSWDCAQLLDFVTGCNPAGAASGLRRPAADEWPRVDSRRWHAATLGLALPPRREPQPVMKGVRGGREQLQSSVGWPAVGKGMANHGLAFRPPWVLGGEPVGWLAEVDMNYAKERLSTISDIARLSGVSKRTVSRVINDSPKVGRATREKVQGVIDQMGYRPNAQARGLAARRSYLLGLIYDNPDALYIDQIQRGVLSVCRQLGYELVVHPCDWDSDTLTSEAIGAVNRSKLDGVVILPPVSEDNDLAGALGKAQVPYVRLASIALDTADHVVIANERSAVAAMAEYLVDLGHRRIGYITGPVGRKSTRERLEGFCDALQKHGCAPCEEMIARGAYTFERDRVLLGCCCLAADAIFASNDRWPE
jgi:LacI family transcriptional regulator